MPCPNMPTAGSRHASKRQLTFLFCVPPLRNAGRWHGFVKVLCRARHAVPLLSDFGAIYVVRAKSNVLSQRPNTAFGTVGQVYWTYGRGRRSVCASRGVAITLVFHRAPQK